MGLGVYKEDFVEAVKIAELYFCSVLPKGDFALYVGKIINHDHEARELRLF